MKLSWPPGDGAPLQEGQAQQVQGQHHPTLPGAILRARQLRRTGLALSAGAIVVAGASAVASGVQLHPPAWLPAAVLVPPTAAGVSLLAAKAALGNALWIEWHGGRLHVERIPPRSGARIEPGDVEVSSADRPIACPPLDALSQCSLLGWYP